MSDHLTTKQKKILVIAGIIVTIGMIYFIYNGIGKSEEIDLNENILVSNSVTKENNIEIQSSEEEDIVVIHITGAVKVPGIVKLKEGSRIEDAIEAAGGLTEDADISKVNLAYILDDGIKIRIPSSWEEDIKDSNILMEDSGENIVQETSPSSTNLNGSININKATEAQLETLPGIGSSLASRIIEYREQNGNFSNIEDIKNVSGIGESKYENIKDFICVK